MPVARTYLKLKKLLEAALLFVCSKQMELQSWTKLQGSVGSKTPRRTPESMKNNLKLQANNVDLALVSTLRSLTQVKKKKKKAGLSANFN